MYNRYKALQNRFINDNKCNAVRGSNLSAGAGLAVGADQVRSVGQVDEQLLLRVQSWSRKIKQQNLQRNTRDQVLGISSGIKLILLSI